MLGVELRIHTVIVWSKSSKDAKLSSQNTILLLYGHFLCSTDECQSQLEGVSFLSSNTKTETKQMKDIVKLLDQNRDFRTAHESSRILGTFILDGVLVRTGLLPRPARNMICSYPRPAGDQRKSDLVVFELARKTGLGVTIGLAREPSFFTERGLGRLLVAGRHPFSRVRSRDLNDVDELVDVVCAALGG